MPSIFHMPAVFPEVLFLAFFAPLLLRVGLAVIFLDESRLLLKRAKKHTWEAAVPVVLGLAIASGFLTQIAAPVALVYALFVGKFSAHESVFKNNLLLLLSALALVSLFITGAGAIAFDLPY